MGVRIIDAEEKGPLGGTDEPARLVRIFPEFVAAEVRGLDLLEVKGKSRGGVDMEFADESRAIARLLETSDHVRGVLAIEPEFPGRQANLAVLVRIEPRKQGRP